MFGKIVNIWFRRKHNIDYKFYDNVIDEVYYDEFMQAIYKSDIESAKNIMEQHYIPNNLKIDFYDEYGKEYINASPAHIAVLSNDKNVLQFIINNGFILNNLDGKLDSPLDYAEKLNYRELYNLLNKKLHSNPYIDLLIDNIKNNNISEIKNLLNSNYNFPQYDINGNTILSYANGNKTIINILRKYGFKSKLELEENLYMDEDLHLTI